MMNKNVLLVSLLMIVEVVSYAFFNQQFLILVLICKCGLLFCMHKAGMLSSICSVARVLLLMIVTTMLLLLPLAIYKSVYSVYFIFSSMAGIVLAYALSSQQHLASRSLRWTLVVVQFLIVLYIVDVYHINPFPLEDILGGAGSSNVVTSFLVLIQSAYVAALFVDEKKAAWGTSFCTLVICFIGYGRGSIISALVLCLIVFLLMLAMRPKKNREVVFFVRVAAVFVAISCAAYLSSDIFVLIQEKTKLGSGLVDDSRLRMISDYVDKIDALSLIVGAGYEGTSISDEFDGNPHNAFIRAHHLYGIFYLAILILVSLVAIFSAGGVGRSVLLSALLMVVVFRAFSEPIIFPTLLDFYYFIIVFLFVRKSSSQGSGVESLVASGVRN